ncbi:Fic family protein [Enterovirga rhinocerotis]|uniref:Fic family protein n=1 Tax=Enterovirga rhinocerotis TaxID=1339210 RepID=A0A4V6PZG4_9HYPH|nr:Fic family protein [Enterovirga rhinocerotis]TDR87259.1 Fic family protein [Enterovirga rhinocerotis]
MPYIYQRPDWPGFRWDAARLSAPLAAVRHRQGRLIGRMQGLGLALRDETAFDMLAEDAVKTSEIEGEVLDMSAVRSSLARRLGLDDPVPAAIRRDADGIVEILVDAVQNHAAPLTEERLFAWHAALFPTGRSGLRRITVGDWRKPDGGPMQVVSGPLGRETVHFEAPPAERVADEMSRFLAWYEAEHPDLDLVLKAAVAHIWFVTIHPFDDGNGRIGRALADMMLARAEGLAQRFYSISARLRVERSAYYATLEAAQKGDLDITARLVWFLGILDKAIADAEVHLATVLRKAQFWAQPKLDGISIRQRKVLAKLLDGFQGKLTASKWAALAGCSPDTALRDIDDLIGRSVLVRADAGGRSTHYLFVASDD